MVPGMPSQRPLDVHLGGSSVLDLEVIDDLEYQYRKIESFDTLNVLKLCIWEGFEVEKYQYQKNVTSDTEKMNFGYQG